MADNILHEHLYGDLLAPTQGYHTDFALGMTYSLGFDALMTAHLAFGMLGDISEKEVQLPFLLLDAIKKNSDRLVIFCNKGNIAVPSNIMKVYSLLEKNIFEVFNPEKKTANFHPKMWLIREVNNDNSKDVMMKLIVSSRNMAYSDNIDCIICMTGKVGNAQTKNEKHKRLKTFIERVTTYSNIAGGQKEKVLAIARDVLRVEKFDVDKPFEDYDFYPYLFGKDFGCGNIEDYLCGTESIIVSPFIDKKILEHITSDRNEHHALVTRKEYVTKEIFNLFAHKNGVFIALDDLASSRMDIHAKMYFVCNGRDKQYLFLGSANATNSAFTRNGEFMIRLKFERGNSKYHQFLKEFYKEGNDSKFIPMNEPCEQITSIREWDKVQQAIKDLMCADDLKANITQQSDNTYSVVVSSSLKKLNHPVFIAPLQLHEMQYEWNGEVLFKGMSADQLSEFYIVSSQTEDEKEHYKAIIKIHTEGMPDDRDTAIYKGIIRNKHDFVKFLELMLSESPVQYLSNELLSQGSRMGENEERHEYAQIYEKMLRVSATNPKQIIHIKKMLEKFDDETVSGDLRKMCNLFSNVINKIEPDL